MSDANSHTPGWHPATYYPDPAIQALDPRFEKYWLKLSAVERLATGLRWAEGPVWVGDGRYLLVQRHPQPAHHQMGRRDRRGQRLPQTLQLRQRQHPRPPGPAGHLRARRAPRGPHRDRRLDHGADGFLQRQAAELAERRRGEIRRLGLVHRSHLRPARQLRGLQSRARDRAQCLPARCCDRQSDHRRRRRARAERALLLAGRENSLCRGIPRRTEPQDPGL